MIRICVYEKLTTHWNPNRTGVSNLSLPKKTRRLRNEKVYFINNTTCYTDTTEFSIKREINRYLRHQQTWYKPKRACRQFLSCVKNRYRAKVVFHRNDEHLLYRSYQWYLNTTWSVACTVIPEVADAYCCYGSENVDRWDGWCRVKSYSDYSKVIQMTLMSSDRTIYANLLQAQATVLRYSCLSVHYFTGVLCKLPEVFGWILKCTTVKKYLLLFNADQR